MLSIVIPYRNEEMLEFTIERVRDTIRVPFEIIALDDGSDHPVALPRDILHLRSPLPVSAQLARHRGIEAARFDCVLVMDAHMNFWNDDWSERLVDYIRYHPSHVGCTVCLGLEAGRMEMEKFEGRYHGAHILPTATEPDDFDVHPGLKRRILLDKWNEVPVVGEIGCIMGGAYFMSRRWYLETLMSPWEELRGWGPSEGIISVVNYLMGGTNVCLDIEIGHMFRPASPYFSNVFEILYNELFLAHVVIADEHELADLIAFLALPDDWDTRMAWELIHRSIHRQYRDYLVRRGKRTWAEYKEQWMNPARKY